MRRAAAVARHLHAAASSSSRFDSAVLSSLEKDPQLEGGAVWVLAAWRLEVGDFSTAIGVIREVQGMLFNGGGRTILTAPRCRTVVGRCDWDVVMIVEFQTTATLAASTFAAQQPKGVTAELVIAMKPGWYHPEDPAPVPSACIRSFSPHDAYTTPSGLVGTAAVGAREGETSGTERQIKEWVEDAAFADKKVWHLNLLKFDGDEGKEYSLYAKLMGRRGGILDAYGARSTMANQCLGVLAGQQSFDRAIFVEYPNRDAYLSMGTNEVYMKASMHRHKGLCDTYIISCLPDTVIM